MSRNGESRCWMRFSRGHVACSGPVHPALAARGGNVEHAKRRAMTHRRKARTQHNGTFAEAPFTEKSAKEHQLHRAQRPAWRCRSHGAFPRPSTPWQHRSTSGTDRIRKMTKCEPTRRCSNCGAAPALAEALAAPKNKQLRKHSMNCDFERELRGTRAA